VGRVEHQVVDQGGAQNHRSDLMFTSRLPMPVGVDDDAIVVVGVVCVVVVVDDADD
jgi:hypothetical protein